MTSRIFLELSWPLIVILPELALLLPFQGSQGKAAALLCFGSKIEVAGALSSPTIHRVDCGCTKGKQQLCCMLVLKESVEPH